MAETIPRRGNFHTFRGEFCECRPSVEGRSIPVRSVAAARTVSPYANFIPSEDLFGEPLPAILIPRIVFPPSRGTAIRASFTRDKSHGNNGPIRNFLLEPRGLRFRPDENDFSPNFSPRRGDRCFIFFFSIFSISKGFVHSRAVQHPGTRGNNVEIINSGVNEDVNRSQVQW